MVDLASQYLIQHDGEGWVVWVKTPPQTGDHMTLDLSISERDEEVSVARSD